MSAKILTEQLQQNKMLSRRQQKQNYGTARIRKSGSFHTDQTRGGSVTSTDDFVTCAEISLDTDSIASNENSCSSPVTDRHFHDCIEITNVKSSNSGSNKMTSKVQKIAKDVSEKTPSMKKFLPDVERVAPVTSTRDDGCLKVDAAEIAYGKAKDVLSWGKSIPVVSLLVGTSEAVAGKALGVVGTDLFELDGRIESELSKFDTGILNPAIEAIAKIVISVAGKSEASMKPIIEILLKPFGLLIKSEANESSPDAHTENPEVTVSK